jgi:hypothetical protein
MRQAGGISGAVQRSWDFFFACREHLGSSIAEEFDAQAPDLKEFVVTRFTNHKSQVTTP